MMFYMNFDGRFHYDNTPMQYSTIFNGCINDEFQFKGFDLFIFLLKT